jgi:glycosyltransferase involved in cell wall biosynthesis
MIESKKLKVLAVVDYYLPGYKGGGPAVSVSRIVGCLNGEFNFCVFTRDRDLGDTKTYEGVQSNFWTANDGVAIYYAKPNRLNIFGIWQVIRETKPDVIYLNSYFSRMTRQVLVLRSLGILRNMPILVAPRGEFSPGALQLKSVKKKAYLSLSNFFKFHSGITWQVSSVHELRDTKAIISTHADYFIKAPDIVDRALVNIKSYRAPKQAGTAEFAFISRISPKKNLLGAIEMLSKIDGDIKFAIYGPIEDAEYWSKCEKASASLPKNIKCEVKGGIPSDQVVDKLSQHHFFLFPTLGENFGHVIPEALTAGCPVVLSDQTPWQDFEKRNVGWVLKLNDHQSWNRVIQTCVDMDTESYATMSENSKGYIAEMASGTRDIDENRKLFDVTIVNQAKSIA